MHAGVGLWLVVVGGRTADIGWFRTKTETFLNDVCVMDRYFCKSLGQSMRRMMPIPCPRALSIIHTMVTSHMLPHLLLVVYLVTSRVDCISRIPAAAGIIAGIIVK